MELQGVHRVIVTLVVMCCWSALTVNTQTVPAGCEGEADVIFLLDSTGLFNKGIHTAAKQFITRQIRNLQIAEDKVRVGVASMAGNGVPEILLKDTYNKEELIQKVEDIEFMNAPSFSYRNSRATVEEIMMVESNGGRKGKVAQVFVPIMMTPPSADLTDIMNGNSNNRDMSDVNVFITGRGGQAFDIPPGQPSAALRTADQKTFFVEDERGLNEIDIAVSKKICEEIPGKLIG